MDRFNLSVSGTLGRQVEVLDTGTLRERVHGYVLGTLSSLSNVVKGRFLTFVGVTCSYPQVQHDLCVPRRLP